MGLADHTMAMSPKSPETPENLNPTPPETAPVPGPPPSSISVALGNLFLLIILVSLVSIPFLVYFTDTGSRAKAEFRKMLRAPAAKVPSASELEAARRRVSELEHKVELLEAREAAAKAQTAPVPAPTPPPAKAALPAPPVPELLPRREYDVAKLFNGLSVRTVLDLSEGATATKERITPGAYEFEVTLKVAVPKANTSLAELSALNPSLPSVLPGLPSLLGSAKVSPFFAKIYSLKHERIKATATRLDQLETRHNYFDCETILDLTHPGTGQKAVLIQAEMDVVADGSDGDRMPTIDDYISLSAYYQPTTSYGWAKKTRTENPLLPRLAKELAEVEAEYAIKGLPPERNRYLNDRRAELKRLLADLASRSYLIAEADPFIVLPLSIVRRDVEATHLPAIGDHAVVIHGGKVYPAICGDSGPSWKTGEASLLLARTIDANAGPYQRPVSDLKVTYLIFPGSAAPTHDAPDLTAISSRCRELLNGLGGLGEGVTLHPWRDIIAERRAVRESNASLVEAKRHLTKIANREAAANAALLKARETHTAAEEALDKAKAVSPAPEPVTLEPLQKALEEKAKLLATAQASAQAAASAKRKATGLADLVTANDGTIRTATHAAYPVPRSETTDVALAKLEESKKALGELAKL